MIKYPASYARMRGLKGKLLEKAQLEGFLSAPDARTIISALARTAYGEQIQDTVDISRLEHELKQELALSYMKILSFLSGSSARFVRALLGRFELLNVKSIIRAIAHKSGDNNSIEPFIFSLGKYHTIPLKNVLEASDLKSFVSLMERTPFARSLEIGYKQYESVGTIFPLEIALDLDYYEDAWNFLNSLGQMDKNNVGKLFGIQCDIANILWTARFKEYYKLPPEQIIQYTISQGWMIRRDVLHKVVSEKDILGAIITHNISPYSRILDSSPSVDGSPIMGAEIGLSRYLYKQCLAVFMKFPLQMSLLFAFFIAKEMQIRDIVTILSGRNLGLAPERIRTYLITL